MNARSNIPLITSFMFAAAACLTTPAQAEKGPENLSELRQSDLIVVGTIKQIRIETERSQIERTWGNYDWAIYVTLSIEHVEKGQWTGDEIEFRCFRINSRRSMGERLTPGGHRPIPGTGTRICAYLNAGESCWLAALPNGITTPNANEHDTFWSRSTLPDAPEIVALQSRRYTYFLPLELWIILCLLSVLLWGLQKVCTRFVRRRAAIWANTEQADSKR